MRKGVIFSGMQPTGPLHLGNYLGALRRWVQLQDDYEMYCGIVDLHALTTMAERSQDLRENVFQVAVDYLAAGLDPAKVTILIQSQVPEHAELHLLLSMVAPLSWLERVPTYKEKLDELRTTSASYGLLGYPVLMAADILLYLADTVPVGKDQLPHLELTREIARRFNHLYGEIFPEPNAEITEAGVLPGLDGRKMSKSYGNVIYLSDDAGTIGRKVRSMFTDPQKAYRTDAGHPESCPVYLYHGIYSAPESEQIAALCRSAKLGCVECKEKLAEALVAELTPLQQRRAELEGDRERVRQILREGAERARRVAGRTISMVKEAMQLPES